MHDPELLRLAAERPEALKARVKSLGLKLGERLRLEGALLKAAASRCSRQQLRVAFVVTANGFIYDDSPLRKLSREYHGGDMRVRPCVPRWAEGGGWPDGLTDA